MQDRLETRKSGCFSRGHPSSATSSMVHAGHLLLSADFSCQLLWLSLARVFAREELENVEAGYTSVRVPSVLSQTPIDSPVRCFRY